MPEKLQLEERLTNQLDDSVKTQYIYYAGVRRVLEKPPVLDTANIDRSKLFMASLLHSLGYFNPEIKDTFYIDTVRKQYRAHINFKVIPGKVLRLDSIGFDFRDSALQRLARRQQDRSLLKKNEPYTQQKVSDELDRLLTVFRNNGFYKLNKEDVFAEVDTVVAALIDPTLDPFEQINLLDSLRKKRENPTINVVFKQHPVKDSSRIKKYYIGRVTVYPDANYEEFDSTKHDTVNVKGYQFIYNSRKFKLPFVASNIYLKPGSLYVQRRYYRTINNFTSLGSWQNVDFELIERKDTNVPTLDGKLRLYPSLKQNLNLSLEASRNVSDILTNGQLFGIGVNGRLLNRNAYREAIQTVTSARFGIELGADFIQTLQASLAHTINFPKFITPIKIKTDSLINPRTVINLNASYTDRLQLFKSKSFNASWGYEWVKGRRREDQDQVGQKWRKTWQYIPFNYEYTDVQKTDSLIKLEDTIPSYKFAFNNGLIMSQILSVSTGIEKDNKLTLLRGRIEESGALFGLIKDLEYGSLARFVKVDGEFKHYINYKHSSWAFRFFAGYGYVYGKADTATGGRPSVIVPENNLPFFKAFYAGGPYSMRAWQIRHLGPGSSTVYENEKQNIERFGNMQLEFNTEFRFNLTTIAGIRVNSALFVDMGNIWSKEFDNTSHQQIPEASFHIDRLYRDLAIGAGSSLRFDFDFFLIRLDWAYKLKDPAHATVNDGWFNDLRVLNGQFQLGLGYPF
ncbi:MULTISPECIES: BamA/TamA family outer membrane protein [Niastella]|uniref:BamA/TamA family outer membrane protein n=1 Tax=Niastella soli TaxID=2821487 RepID=A0ABS3YV68_9BACT|nr:BamA/TamA family outer membrane protein [Niastella soli]MBO9201826.1 BamA/TamA family outer membrane protein [Niastella soli]